MPKHWPIKKIKKWLSSLRAGNSKLQLSTAQFQPQPAKLLSRCEDVTMKQFIGCICDNDLRQLVTDGEASAEQIAEAWASLFLEYCDLANHTEVRYKLRLEMEVSYLKSFITFTESCIEYLKVADEARHNMPNVKIQGFIDGLHAAGWEHDLNPSDRDQYLKDLLRIEAELRPHKLRLVAKQSELDEIKKGSIENEAVERKYFTTIFTRINNYCKREAVNMQTTVEMYCAALRDYVSAIEESKVK
jgi:hypothetical protein